MECLELIEQNLKEGGPRNDFAIFFKGFFLKITLKIR